jgi:hypothetical protein
MDLSSCVLKADAESLLRSETFSIYAGSGVL